MSAARAARCRRWLMVGEVVVPRRALAVAADLSPSRRSARHARWSSAALMAALGIAALGLVVVPACVTAWMAIFTAGLSYALLVGRSGVPFDTYAGDPVHAGRRHLRRADGRPLGLRPAQDQRRSARRAESAACCSRNMSIAASAGCGRSMPRIASIYISLADDRPARPLGQPADRPFAARRCSADQPSSAACCSTRQPFDNLEMELKTARGAALDQICRAIRSSTSPAGSRASAASARTSPRSARPRSG